MQASISPSPTRWTAENIIDLIRRLRNDLIKDFLDERFLKSYLKREFNIHELPQPTLELVRSHLKELLISPVDVKHYADLIGLIKNSDTASLSEGNEKLFYQEIELHLKKYIF